MHRENIGSNGSVTLQDVADVCGVNKTTVSRALRGDTVHVSPPTIARVKEAAQRLGYDPARHHAARRLAFQKTGGGLLNHVVALFLPLNFYSLVYWNRVFQGIVEVLWSERFAVLAHHSYIDRDEPVPYLFSRGELDGGILVGTLPELVPIAREKYGIGDGPIVTLMDSLKGASAVCPDDYDGAYAAISHLLDLGHRHFMHSAVRRDDIGLGVTRRLEAYRQACAERGIDPDSHLHLFQWDYEQPEQLEEPFVKTLREHPQVTAVLAVNDLAATYIYSFLISAGYSVPEDISLVGFDDVEPILGEHCGNILTTVSVQLEEIGREAARLLIRKLSEHGAKDEVVSLPTQLVVRSSTAPPRQIW